VASAITHVVAAAGIGCWFHRPGVPRAVWAAAVVAAVIPDADVIGFRFGIPYDSVFGHRGISHSIAFAAALASLLALGVFRNRDTGLRSGTLWTFLFLVTASHGVLDAFTNGGLGIACFAPLWNARYFFPVTPIEVSPLSVTGFLNERGLRILANEAVWVWLPAALAGAAGLWVTRFRRKEPVLAG